MALEIEDTSTPESEPSLRDTLMEATAEHSEPSTETTEVVEPSQGAESTKTEQRDQETATDRAARDRDEKGRFKTPEEKAAEKKSESKQAKPGEKVATEKPAVQAYKPPQSWKPEARSELLKAHPLVQQEAARREREIQQVMREKAEDTRITQNFKQVMAPYEAFIRSEGSNAFQAVDSMMRTAVGLRTLPAGPKAELMAELCDTFGVDPQKLDEAWFNRTQGRGAQRQPVAQPAPQQQFRDPRLDPLIARLQQHEEQEYQVVVAERDKFAESHPFFEDVRPDMADIVEMRGKRGLETTWDQAYDMACRNHPDVAGVYEQQLASVSARRAQPSTARARAAASSLRPSSGVRTPAAADPSDLRAVLEEQMSASRSR
jgi:hypothetical protein